MVLAETWCFNFLEKNLNAACTPFVFAYLPMAARISGVYFLYGPRFFGCLLSTISLSTSWFALAIARGATEEERDPIGLGQPAEGWKYFNNDMATKHVFEYRK